MHSLLAKWNRDQNLPLSYRVEHALRYVADLAYARIHLFGKGLNIGKQPRIRKKPVLRNSGKLKIGNNFFLNSEFAQSHIVVLPGGHIEVGDQVIINFGAAISSQAKITFGNRCHVGPHVMIMDTNYHAIEKNDRQSGSGRRGEIVIGDDVWIASRVTILPGTKIGRGSVISSGSVVSGIIPPNVVVAGNPAMVVKTMGSDQTNPPAADTVSSPKIHVEAANELAVQVAKIVKETFFVVGDVDINWSADKIEGWDSLGLLRLISNIERAFGVSLAQKDVGKMNSVNTITTWLRDFIMPKATPVATTVRKIPTTGDKPLKVAILRNYTIEPLVDVLKNELSRMGFRLELYLGDFDTVAADVLGSDSKFHTFCADFIIVSLWLEALAPKFVRAFLSVGDDKDRELERIVNHCRMIVRGIRERSKAPILINNFPDIFPPVLGILDSQKTDFQSGSLQELNRQIIEMSASYDNVFVVDFHGKAALMGAERFYSEKLWHMGKIPLTDEAFVETGRLYCRFFRALSGKSKKCLVVDCDNTLWGGVVGDEGAHGVALGPTFPGSCYVNFQEEILGLHDRGVILAMCSKNNENDALEVFRVNEHSILKEHHFATWEINWNDKASNIRNIAKVLNIGLDSMVFIDDSPFECDLVRSAIAEVEVIQVPSNPEHMAGLIAQSGLFDSLNFTDEDRVKNSMYRAEAQRNRIREESTDLEGYLFSVELKADIRLGHIDVVERLAQLTQKTNQFNLTTTRYSDDDIRRVIEADDSEIFYLKAADKIADFGIVGVAIIRIQKDCAYIDSFLLSCRVLGRGIETMFLRHIMDYLKLREISLVYGAYLPSAKNGQVADFYSKHGFEPTDDHGWMLKMAAPLFASPKWITLVHGLV